jgi:hypothetical protein
MHPPSSRPHPSPAPSLPRPQRPVDGGVQLDRQLFEHRPPGRGQGIIRQGPGQRPYGIGRRAQISLNLSSDPLVEVLDEVI